MSTLPSKKPRIPILGILSILLALVSLLGFGLTWLLYNALLADAVGISIIASFFIGVCTGCINALGIILGIVGLFLSRRALSIIGIVLNLAVLIGIILVFT